MQHRKMYAMLNVPYEERKVDILSCTVLVYAMMV